MAAELPREFDRIARLFRPLAAGFPGALDLTDDAAVFAPPPGHELVVTNDASVGGVHFVEDWAPEDIAAKLLRTNLSDLAAMGARPLAYTLATSLPRSVSDAWLARFCAGLAADQQAFGIHLAGGDSTSIAGPMVFSVTAFGTVPAGGALRRNGARPGDLLCVTGTPGDAALALAHVLDGRDLGSAEDTAALLERLHRPMPRLAVAELLRREASAALDLSDGLPQDVGHIARASGVAIVIDAALLPRSPAAARALAAHPDLGEAHLVGGDDYELAFTLAPERLERVTRDAAAAGVAVTAIGHVGQGSGVTVLDAGGAPLQLSRLGWSHF